MFFFSGLAAASSEGDGHGEVAPKGWVATDTYRVLNFAVLAVGLFLIVRKPASNFLGKRVEEIKRKLGDLEGRKVRAEKELAKYDEKLAGLDDEARQVVKTYIEQGKTAKARIIDEAKSAAEKLEAQARRNIEHEFSLARVNLKNDVVQKAIDKAEAFVRDKISDTDQERLVDEYLEKVVSS